MGSLTRHCWILILGLAASSAAAGNPNEAVVDGMEVRIGLVAAERLRAYPRDSVESSMHGGVPRGSGHYHVNVAIRDAATHAFIRGSRVEAQLGQAGLAPERKLLQPMTINGGEGYGQYFRLTGRAPATLVLRITRPGSTHVTEATFRPQAR